jgi:hypothetical protein
VIADAGHARAAAVLRSDRRHCLACRVFFFLRVFSVSLKHRDMSRQCASCAGHALQDQVCVWEERQEWDEFQATHSSGRPADGPRRPGRHAAAERCREGVASSPGGLERLVRPLGGVVSDGEASAVIRRWFSDMPCDRRLKLFKRCARCCVRQLHTLESLARNITPSELVIACLTWTVTSPHHRRNAGPMIFPGV